MINHSKVSWKVGLTALLLGLAIGACAFQEDKPRGAQFGPEQSQDQLAQEQTYQGRVDPVGTVEDKTGDASTASVSSDSSGNSFAAAETAKARASFNNANKTITEHKNPPNTMGILMLLVGGLVLAAVAFKNYSDKAVPLPKSLQ